VRIIIPTVDLRAFGVAFGSLGRINKRKIKNLILMFPNITPLLHLDFQARNHKNVWLCEF